MKKIRVVHLLNDFGLGGVTRGLSVFGNEIIGRVAHSTTMAINPDFPRALVLNADVIVTHFPPSWRRLAFLLSLRLLNPRARLIHVEHSYSREWEAIDVKNVARFQLMLKISFKFFDRIVAVSHGQERWLVETGAVAAENITVIYPSSVTVGLDQVPISSNTSGRPLIVGAFGRFHAAKGFDRLIDAFNRMTVKDNIRLVLGGFGPDHIALATRAARNPLISFVGKVRDIPAFMRDCDVVVIPSRYESYGQVADEARQAGRPIMVSNVGGLPEQVGDAGIVIDCDDPDALLAALKGLGKLPLAEMARAGRHATRTGGNDRSMQWAQLLNEPPRKFIKASGLKTLVPT